MIVAWALIAPFWTIIVYLFALPVSARGPSQEGRRRVRAGPGQRPRSILCRERRASCQRESKPGKFPPRLLNSLAAGGAPKSSAQPSLFAWPVVPKSLMTFGASLLTARAAMRLKRAEVGRGRRRSGSSRTWWRSSTQGSVWKQAGSRRGCATTPFRRRVPLQTYEDLAPHIEQMKKGAEDVLWPGQCQIYAMTAGTTTGSPKSHPRHRGDARPLQARGARLDALVHGAGRARRASSGAATSSWGARPRSFPIPESEPFEAYAGELSGIEALNLPNWAEKHFYEPGPEIAQIADWQQKIAAITERTCRDRHLAPRGDAALGPHPGRVAPLERDARQGPGGPPAGNLAQLRVLRPQRRADRALP